MYAIRRYYGLDIGVHYRGFYGDAALTLPVGKVSAHAERLLAATEESLYRGIEKAVPGNRLSDVSAAIQECVEKEGFTVVSVITSYSIHYTKLYDQSSILAHQERASDIGS